MIKRLLVAAVAVAGISFAMPAGAEEVGIGVGPAGVTVGPVMLPATVIATGKSFVTATPGIATTPS